MRISPDGLTQKATPLTGSPLAKCHTPEGLRNQQDEYMANVRAFHLLVGVMSPERYFWGKVVRSTTKKTKNRAAIARLMGVVYSSVSRPIVVIILRLIRGRALSSVD